MYDCGYFGLGFDNDDGPIELDPFNLLFLLLLLYPRLLSPLLL